GSVRFTRTATGHTVWSFQTGGRVASTPALVFGATIRRVVQDAVIAGSDDGRVYALSRATGKQLWRFQTGGPVRSSPLVLQDARPPGAPQGLVVVGSNDGHLYALSLSNGAKVWAMDAGGPVVSSAAYAAQPTAGPVTPRKRAGGVPFVAVGSGDGTVRAFD